MDIFGSGGDLSGEQGIEQAARKSATAIKANID